MRNALAVLLVLASLGPAVAEDDPKDVRVTKWLVLAPVDPTPRRTLRADAVFAKHLLDRASPPPREGDEITGTLGKPAKWATKDADKDGEVELASGGWAYASVVSATDRVVIAKLEGAGVMYVNGAGFPGDVYRLGDIGVPVALQKGANDVYVAGPRGAFRLTLTRVASEESDSLYEYASHRLIPDPNRHCVPDAVEGEPTDEPLSSNRLFNTSRETTSVLSRGLSIVPLGVGSWRGDIVLGNPTTRTAKKVDANAPRRRTFISNIDGSVQSYALVPPAPGGEKGAPIGLVLSLHGAGVECMDQAKAYAPKPDFWIVCPTNRGRFGFDWQDWGRLDAYEVLEDALKVTGVDPRRVYLTGHSMGGHGTWHLAANDPGRFLAIAPSAGWCSFETYSAPKFTSPLAWMWRAADGASQTLELVENLAQVPTYVLHGEKDDNVPLAEAQLMVDAITRAGGKPEFHVEPGVGHWWDKDKERPGADCVDWPGIWELFRETQPKDESPMEISFTSMSLAVTDRHAWIGILQPADYCKPCRVRAHSDIGRRCVIVTTENVRGFFVDPGEAGERARLVIDGKPRDLGSPLSVRVDGKWREPIEGDAVGQAQCKRPERGGPFKHAFTNRFLLVYGTAGTDTEDAELLEKARYDSEVWAYRANGDANLMSDAQFLAGDFQDRNVIVYGNADTNSAWTSVFDDDCPIVAKRGTMTVNGAKHDGVVAAAFVRPRKGSAVALAAAFADTGAAATRLFYAFPVFSSGIGIPDYVVFGPGFLKEWDGDVRAAGWFDFAWRMK